MHMNETIKRQAEVITELKTALEDIQAYAASEKFNSTASDPIPTMNPADIVNRVRD